MALSPLSLPSLSSLSKSHICRPLHTRLSLGRRDLILTRRHLQASSFRFVANEMALPPQLAFGDFLYVVVVRHPRELALARFRGSPMYHKNFDDRKLAAFLKRGIKGGGGVHNVMTRPL